MSLVAPDMVVSFHFTLKNAEGEVLDATDKGDPMPYLHGANNIVPGLEKAMLSRKVGDKFAVTVSASEGYGERVEGTKEIPRAHFPEDAELAEGMGLMAENAQGDILPLWIVAVSDDTVTVDQNHPLAGEELHYEIEIADIRPATEDEIAHGHPHGPDGHHHH